MVNIDLNDLDPDELIAMANIMKKQKKIPEAKSGCFQSVENTLVIENIKPKAKFNRQAKVDYTERARKIVDVICESNTIMSLTAAIDKASIKHGSKDQYKKIRKIIAKKFSDKVSIIEKSNRDYPRYCKINGGFAKKKVGSKKGVKSNYNLFTGERIKIHMKYDGMSYIDALHVSQREWNQKKVNIEFPTFKTIDFNLKKILVDIVQTVINQNGCIIFKHDAYAIGIDNVPDWRNFIAEFMRNSSIIASYFGIKNSFKVMNNEIHYK